MFTDVAIIIRTKQNVEEKKQNKRDNMKQKQK